VHPFAKEICLIASEEHRFMAVDAIESSCGLDNSKFSIILEPASRNTSAAMALAAINSRPEQLLLFCPADHYLPDIEGFAKIIHQGVDAANGDSIVTFGVAPTYPSTAYGYLAKGAARSDGTFNVAHFQEKPTQDIASKNLMTGKYLWNSGIILCRAETLIKALGIHAPDILECCVDAMTKASSDKPPSGHIFVRPNKEAFNNCREQSIDYAVMEHYDNVVVVPFQGQWSDVGSWNAYSELIPDDSDGNRLHGECVVKSSKNTFVYAQKRLVAALGVSDLLIIDTPDACLIAHRDQAEAVKDLVKDLESVSRIEAITHQKVARPWGWYECIDNGDRFQVKHIGVKPGASLSLQKHHHRAEHWIVVKGTAEVTCGERCFLLSENQSTFIPIGEVHRLHNPGKVDLELIEVQSGSYLAEDDIVRLDDSYGRQSPVSSTKGWS